MRISSPDWFKAGVARQRADPISLGISPCACTILSKLLLLLLLLLFDKPLKLKLRNLALQKQNLAPAPSPAIAVLFTRRDKARLHSPALVWCQGSPALRYIFACEKNDVHSTLIAARALMLASSGLAQHSKVRSDQTTRCSVSAFGNDARHDEAYTHRQNCSTDWWECQISTSKASCPGTSSLWLFAAFRLPFS